MEEKKNSEEKALKPESTEKENKPEPEKVSAFPEEKEKEAVTGQQAEVCKAAPMDRKNVLGKVLMLLGALLLVGALGLYAWNQKEAMDAKKASMELLPQVQEAIMENVQSKPNNEPIKHVNPYDQEAVKESLEMPTVVINGWRYVGFLHIPALELELPVMSDWSYRKLQIAPCRHMGSTKSDDLVIAAHNYPSHFGKIRDLQPGDQVEFVDMEGILNQYQVCTVNQIEPTDIEEVQDESLDLVLYTCTYGGTHRIMVGCQRIIE